MYLRDTIFVYMLEFLWKGLVLGFAMAVPVGPIGLLCIRKTIHFGKVSGFCAGLGAAAADTIYGFFSAFFLTFMPQYLQDYHDILKVLGGFFLFALSWRIFRAPVPTMETRLHKMGLFKDFVGTFFLTLMNPLTLFAFIGILASLGLVDDESSLHSAALLVIGVFCGSALWWLILSEGVGRLRKKINPQLLKRINYLAGSIIALFGLWSLLTVASKL
jgi:threonine/homoserine/homoserine lactone efflux protein